MALLNFVGSKITTEMNGCGGTGAEIKVWLHHLLFLPVHLRNTFSLYLFADGDNVPVAAKHNLWVSSSGLN